MNIELRHLRYFLAVAEGASFTAAAQSVHVTQQVVSTQVRQLEDAVGVELLRRTSRGVVLTPAGEAFLGPARETLASLDRSIAAARNAALAVSGALRVGLQAATGGAARTRVLAAFEAAYPSVAVILRAYDLAQPAAGLLDHSSDVALLRPPVDAPGILFQAISEEPRVFVLPEGHPLAGSASLGLADVAGLPWVAAPPATDGCAPERWRDDWLMNPRPGGGVPVIGAVARTIEEWREHIVAGRGISLCPASSEAFSARPGLVFVSSRGVPATVLGVAWRAEDVRPQVLAFVKLAAAGGGGTAKEAGGGTAEEAGGGTAEQG